MSNKFVPIGELFNLEKGDLQSTKCTPGEFDFITAAEDWKTHHEYTHDCEALIIAVAASGSLGRTHYVDGKFIPSDLCFVLTPKNEQKYPLNLAFYHFVFNSIRSVLVAATKSGTSKESINQTNLKKYELPYFDIEQQDLWINKLRNTLSRKKLFGVELTHQRTLLKKLRQQILQEAIEGKLTADWRAKNPNTEPASELLKRIQTGKEKLIKEGKIKKQPLPQLASKKEIDIEMPDSWQRAKLGSLVCPLRGITYGIVKMGSKPKKNGVYALRCSDVRFRKFDLSGARKVSEEISNQYKRTILEGGEILLNIRGTLGGCAIVDDSMKGYNIAREVGLIPLVEQSLNAFLLSVLTSPYFNREIEKNLRGIAYKGLNLNILSKLLIPIPPMEEQKVIVAKVEKLLKVCDQLEIQIMKNQTHAEQLMQAVLKEAFQQSAA